MELVQIQGEKYFFQFMNNDNYGLLMTILALTRLIVPSLGGSVVSMSQS